MALRPMLPDVRVRTERLAGCRLTPVRVILALLGNTFIQRILPRVWARHRFPQGAGSRSLTLEI